MKSESECLNTEEAASTTSVSVASVSSPAHSVSADIYPTVSVKQEHDELPDHQQRELKLSCECHCGNHCRADCEGDLLCRVEVKQEPSSPVTDTVFHMSSETDTACHVSSETDTACQMSSETDTVCHMSSASTECQLLPSHTSTVPLFSSKTTDPELNIETTARELTVTDVKCEGDNVAAAAAAAAAADADVNVLSSSESLTGFTEASELPVTAATISIPTCSSISLSSAVLSSSAVSVPQELLPCRDSLGKTYYIPRNLLLPVQPSCTVNCSNSRPKCSLSSSCLSSSHSSNVASVTLSCSPRNCDSLPSVCDVACTSTKSVLVKPDGHVTTSSHLYTSSVQPSLLAGSLSLSVTQNPALSSTASATAVTSSYTQSTSTFSSSSHTSRTTPTSQRLQVYLTPEKCRDQVRMTVVPHSVLNNAVIKPRPLVPLCGVNSPARSLPHITVLSSISSVLPVSRNVSLASSVTRTQRPSCHVQRPSCHVPAKLVTSSSSPVYFVIGGGNNKVISSRSSHSLMEVVLVPATKDTPQKAVGNMQPVAAAGVNGRCINKSSASLSRFSDTAKVSSSSLPSSPYSITSVNKISKSCSSSQISLLRPQTTASSMATTKPSLVEPRAQMKRTSSSSSLNVFATKIGNQTVIVDIGSLSSSKSTAVKPAASVPSVSFMKPKHLLVSRSAASQHDTTSTCGNVLLRSSSPFVDTPSVCATDEVFKNCASVIRYFDLYCFF